MAAITKKQQLIDDAKVILREYSGKITLRQLYYRLVSKHIIQNDQKEYKRLIMAMSDARVKSRQVSFDAFEDKGRSFIGRHGRWSTTPERTYERAEETFESAESTFQDTADDFNLPAWYGQSTYVEVWCEKDALTNVFEPVCRSHSVVYGAAKGMPSLSWLYDAALRIDDMIPSKTDLKEFETKKEELGKYLEMLRVQIEDEEDEDSFQSMKAEIAKMERDIERMEEFEHIDRVVILVYSDFDPAGIDIYKNIKRHLLQTFGLDIEVIRMAITEAQIAKYNILPMPTKPSDSRYKKWVAQYGDVSCVELDAIEPKDLGKIIKKDIMDIWDKDASERRRTIIKEGREDIQVMIDNYSEEEE